MSKHRTFRVLPYRFSCPMSVPPYWLPRSLMCPTLVMFVKCLPPLLLTTTSLTTMFVQSPTSLMTTMFVECPTFPITVSDECPSLLSTTFVECPTFSLTTMLADWHTQDYFAVPCALSVPLHKSLYHVRWVSHFTSDYTIFFECPTSLVTIPCSFSVPLH